MRDDCVVTIVHLPSATHGVIRTAPAVRSLSGAGAEPHALLVDELAQGLGFWAARYQTVPGNSQHAGGSDSIAALRPLPRLDLAIPY